FNLSLSSSFLSAPPPTPEPSTLSLHDALPISVARHLGMHIPGNPTVVPQNMPAAGGLGAANHLNNVAARDGSVIALFQNTVPLRSEEHTSELQSLTNLVCRLLLDKKTPPHTPT